MQLVDPVGRASSLEASFNSSRIEVTVDGLYEHRKEGRQPL